MYPPVWSWAACCPCCPAAGWAVGALSGWLAGPLVLPACPFPVLRGTWWYIRWQWTDLGGPPAIPKPAVGLEGPGCWGWGQAAPSKALSRRLLPSEERSSRRAALENRCKVHFLTYSSSMLFSSYQRGKQMTTWRQWMTTQGRIPLRLPTTYQWQCLVCHPLICIFGANQMKLDWQEFSKPYF